MKEIKIIRLQGRGNRIIVKGLKSKREREFVIEHIIHSSLAYRQLYRLRKSI